MIRFYTHFLAVMFSCLLLALPAQAVVVTYTDLGTWQAAAGTTLLEDLNTTPLGFTPSLDVGDFTITQGGFNNFGAVIKNGSGVNGSRHLEWITDGADAHVTFDFDYNVFDFGFDYHREGTSSQGGSGIISLDVDGMSFNFSTQSGSGVLGFFGITSDSPISSLSFQVNGFTTKTQFDDFRYSSMAPEFIWDGSLGSNNWNAIAILDTNWDTAINIPGSTDTVRFDDTAADFVVNLNGDRTVIEATFDGASGYTLNNNTLTLHSGDINPNGTATHTINSGVTLGNTDDWLIDDTSTLVINGSLGGAFDLTTS